MSTPHPLSGRKPPKGRRLIIRGAYLGGSFTPTGDGGTYATYHGMVNGHAAFRGRTADTGWLVNFEGVTWELR